MAYREKRVQLFIPEDLAAEINALDLPGSQTERCIWLLRQAVKVQKVVEAQRDAINQVSNSSTT